MLSIILPAYLEKDNLEILIPRIEKVLGNKEYEVIVVDDNSQDGTEALVEKLSGSNPAIRLLKRKGKLGLSSAIVDGVKSSKGENILVMDADLSHPPEKIAELSEALEENDLAVGSRNLQGGGVENWPIHRKLISWGATMLARLLLGVRLTDPMSGFFAVKKSIFQNMRFRIKGYKILLNIIADNPNIRIREVPYLFKDRFAGETKLGSGEIILYMSDIIRIKFG